MAIVETPGICIRAGECQVARLGRCVNIPLGARFICPGCGHSLAPPAQPSVLASRRASMNAVPLAIFAGAGLVVLGVSVLLGWQLGAVRSAHAAPTPAAVQLPHSAPTPTPTPPSIAAAPAPHPPAQLAALPPAPVPVAPHAILAAAAAPRHDEAAPPAVPHAIVQQAVARIPAPAAPESVDHPFSTRTVAGGMPAFPASYDAKRSGRVTVSCTIGTDGAPAGCVTLWEQGGRFFATSVQSWLGSGQVRFQPAAHPHRESWTVVFN